MELPQSGAAPDVRTVLTFVSSLAWRSRWLIGLSCVLAVALTYFLYKPEAVSAWTGKTIIRIGLAPTSDYLLQETSPPLAPIEPPRNLVARISDPVFRTKVIEVTTFEEHNAVLSKSLASSSLRGVAMDNGRDVAVEVSAASRADVEAVFRALSAEIGSAHGRIAQQRLDTLHASIDDAKSRIAVIEKSSTDLLDRLTNSASDSTNSGRFYFSLVPGPLASAETWNRLKDRVERDTNLIKFTEKTVVDAEPGTYPATKRNIGALEASILAGFAMLAFMIVLTILTKPPRRSSN